MSIFVVEIGWSSYHLTSGCRIRFSTLYSALLKSVLWRKFGKTSKVMKVVIK